MQISIEILTMLGQGVCNDRFIYGLRYQGDCKTMYPEVKLGGFFVIRV